MTIGRGHFDYHVYHCDTIAIVPRLLQYISVAIVWQFVFHSILKHMLLYRASVHLNFDHRRGPGDKFLSKKYGSEVIFHIRLLLGFAAINSLNEQVQETRNKFSIKEK